jgi:hypothetical protein
MGKQFLLLRLGISFWELPVVGLLILSIYRDWRDIWSGDSNDSSRNCAHSTSCYYGVEAADVQLSSLRPDEIALLQFDSRPLQDYWKSAADWNNYYCALHGHQFIYYTINSPTACKHGDEQLYSAWCKVKAMLQAHDQNPHIKLFIYMDSDAVISRAFANTSVNAFLETMQSRLDWDPQHRPMVFNQDGPCWWCNLVMERGYTMCLNAGTVMWYRHENSLQVLREWWDASMDSYVGNPIRRPFRMKWPWEQDRQMALYNRTGGRHIQIASQPTRPVMQLRAGHLDWCLSHVPASGCFIAHHCEDKESKDNLISLYELPSDAAFVVGRYSNAIIRLGLQTH